MYPSEYTSTSKISHISIEICDTKILYILLYGLVCVLVSTFNYSILGFQFPTARVLNAVSSRKLCTKTTTSNPYSWFHSQYSSHNWMRILCQINTSNLAHAYWKTFPSPQIFIPDWCGEMKKGVTPFDQTIFALTALSLLLRLESYSPHCTTRTSSIFNGKICSPSILWNWTAHTNTTLFMPASRPTSTRRIEINMRSTIHGYYEPLILQPQCIYLFEIYVLCAVPFHSLALLLSSAHLCCVIIAAVAVTAS